METTTTRWSKPNLIRQHGLNKLDGFSWQEAEEYDTMERRESELLEALDERKLTPAENDELKGLQQSLWNMDEAVRARRNPPSVITAAAA